MDEFLSGIVKREDSLPECSVRFTRFCNKFHSCTLKYISDTYISSLEKLQKKIKISFEKFALMISENTMFIKKIKNISFCHCTNSL